MKKNILYVGNYLKNDKSNLSYMYVLGSLLENEDYTVFYTSNKNNKIFRLLDMFFCFFKTKSRVDVILIDTYSTLNFYYAFIISQLSRFFKIDYITILHGGNLPERLKSSPRLCNKVFKNAYINISPSLYLKNEFEKFGYKNVKFIPNAIEIDNYPLRQKNNDTIRLFWLRSFSKIYNPKMAIDVLKKIKDLNYDVELCMVGPDSDGSMQIVKEYAKELNVELKIPGKLSKPEWIELSQSYNIFINTTNFDNMPLSIIEAMALGFPIVSTNAGGLSYLIKNQEDGLLVDKGNVDEMVSAVIKIHENQELAQKLSHNARTKAEGFEWQIIKKQWNAILN